MALLRYLRPVDGLPDPRGSLSSSIPTQTIAEANKEVQKAISKAGGKHGAYQKYSPIVHSDIGKHVCQHMAQKKKVSESTVKSIEQAYLEELRKRARTDDGGEIAALPVKKRGRKVLLGEDLDCKVQIYLKKVREGGGAVSARITMAAARGSLLKCDLSMLAEFGGTIELNRHWGHSLLKRMKFVQRKATAFKSEHTATNFTQLKKAFLDGVTTAVTREEIPPELTLNWDQTGIKFIPCSSWTMEKRGEKRVEMIGVDDKRQITAVFCGSLIGDFLPVQLIYKGTTPLSPSVYLSTRLIHYPLSKALVDRGNHAAVHRAHLCALHGEGARGRRKRQATALCYYGQFQWTDHRLSHQPS